MELAVVLTNGFAALFAGITAFLTWRIAKESAKGAEVARDAAESSRLAAQAALRSTLVMEASVQLHFELEPDRHRDGTTWMTLRAYGASVWVHSARLVDWTVYASKDSNGEWFRDRDLDTMNEPPVFLEAGDAGISLDWRESGYRASDWGVAGKVEVVYSLAKDSEAQVRTVTFHAPDDLFEVFQSKERYFLDLDRNNNGPEPLDGLGSGAAEPRA